MRGRVTVLTMTAATLLSGSNLYPDEYGKVVSLHPQVAMSAGGSFVIVWGDMDHVYAQRHDPAGGKVGEAIVVDRGIPTGHQEPPEVRGQEVAMNDQGTFVVAWESSGIQPESHFRLFSVNGDLLGQGTVPVRNSPTVAMSAGKFLFTSMDLPTATAVGQLFNMDGSPSSPMLRIVTARQILELDTALDAGDRIFAAYAETKGLDQIFFLGFEQESLTFQRPISSEDAQHPTVAMGSVGDIAVAWEERLRVAIRGPVLKARNVFLGLFGSDGGALRSPLLVNQEISTEHTGPEAAVDGAGDIVLVYGAQHGEQSRIFSRRFRFIEEVMSEPLLVAEEPSSEARNKNPAVAFRAGRQVVVWEKVYLKPGGEFDRSEVRFRVFDGSGDRDLDGLADALDACPDRYNPSGTDTDQDGIPDGCDPDMDGDGVLNAADNCRLARNADQADRDQDQIGDACDNCPAAANYEQTDHDRDTLGNLCDPCPLDDSNADPDEDAICSSFDNCPSLSNPGQEDIDGDLVGNFCDNCGGVQNPDQADSNGNGVGDRCERFIRGDANRDGAHDISDPIYILGNLFTGAPSLCRDAMDSNDDGSQDISDPIYLIGHLFFDAPGPPPPFPEPGVDPTFDQLGCEGFN